MTVTPSALCDVAEKAAPGHALDLLLAAVKVCAGRKQAARKARVYEGITPHDVVAAVSHITGVPQREIMGLAKYRTACNARHIAWLVTYEQVKWTTMVELQQFFRRDHKTVFMGLERARTVHRETADRVAAFLRQSTVEAAE